MSNKKKKIRPVYNTAFKLEVISKVLDGTFTKQEAQSAYRIGGKSTILEWIRQLVPADENLSQSVKTALFYGSPDPKDMDRFEQHKIGITDNCFNFYRSKDWQRIVFNEYFN